MLFFKKQKKEEEPDLYLERRFAGYSFKTADEQKTEKVSFFKKIINGIIFFFRILRKVLLINTFFVFLAFYLIFSGKPFDLGIKGTQEDALLFEEKILKILHAEEKEVSFKENEFSAFLNKQLQNSLISDIQTDFKKGKLEMVGILKKAVFNYDLPIKLIIQPTIENERLILNPSYFKIGRLPLPLKIYKPFFEKIENKINESLEEEFLRRIEDIKVEEKKIIFYLK